MQQVEACLPPPVLVKGDPGACKSLTQRMAELHVPGVSIAIVHNGSVDWARGYGVQELGGSAVTAETIFQAGSISKPIAALAALRLVQDGKLSLDSDVNAKLISWKIPPSSAVSGAVVTLRELITHTAGFTVHGFPGYAANEPIPTLVQVLNGQPPANTPPIRLESVPGTKWNYSGGGFTVMQQLVLDVAKEPSPKLLHDTVLVPIGMTHSTYQQPLPSDRRAMAAMPYTASGTAVPGGPHTYPEMAAAGLWTTPSDLAKYIIEVRQSLAGHANHVLSQVSTRQMLTPGMGNWGLGVEIGGSASNPYFTHGGVNEGYESLFAAYEHGGDGAVVMTNAQGGSRLASQIMSSIAVAYDWPDFRPAVRTQVKLDPETLDRYVGTYEITPQFSITFTRDGNQLMTQATNQSKLPIYPESDRKFFLKVVDAEVEFFTGDNGQVSYLILHQNGHETKAVKQ
jgi:CubicO group peptidase (beta-lactamase class C family)